MDVSVVIPVCNEVENLPRLYRRLVESLAATGRTFELLFVDDGSCDGSTELLRELAKKDDRVHVLVLRRNFGQTAAMHAGLQHAAGEYVVTIDADLQNDPGDIPTMLDKLDEDFDLVHGWRKDRHDRWLDRKLPSLIANRLIAWTTRFPIHDLGCTLKAMRREIAQELELYGEMHRFIPILAHARGARCCEVVVSHHARQFGQTKYGISRTLRVLLDLVTVKYLIDYFASPMKLFGRFALVSLAAAALSLIATITMRAGWQIDMTGNPLLLAAVLFLVVSGQFFGLGLLGEVSARIYFAQPGRQSYAVRERWKREQAEESSGQALRRAA
jgi:glycosyltransferase involved in cell wall biosynthesis